MYVAAFVLALASQEPLVDDPLARGDRALFDEKDDTASYQSAVAAYEAAEKAGRATADTFGKKAEAWLRQGDLLKDEEQKRERYKKGQEAAEAGIKLDAKCARCHFWRAANLGRWGEQKGVLNALFLLDDVKAGFQTALRIDPGNIDAKLAMGKIDEAVPGFAGGSTERAEKTFREVIKADPRFGRAKLDLAELIAKDDREGEAKRLAQEVIDEKSPRRPGEHRKFDVPRARALLRELAE